MFRHNATHRFFAVTLLSALLAGLFFVANTPPTYAASIAGRSQNTFPIAGGTISGSIVHVANARQAASIQANITSFQASTDTLIASSIQYFQVIGKIQKDGAYSYPYTMTLQQAGNGLEAIELSIDTKNHTQLIAVGTPTTQALLLHEQTQQRGTSARSVSSATMSSTSSSSPLSSNNPLSSGTKSVKFTIDWYDPIGIEVNALTDYLTFSYNGSTTTYISGSDSRWWLSEDGWREQSHNIYGYNYWGGNVRTYVYTNDVFANTPFCTGHTTYVYDTQNTAEGLSNGNVTGFTDSAYATGENGTIACAPLLHYSSWLN